MLRNINQPRPAVRHPRPAARHLVHRSSTAEVFVGDLELDDAGSFHATAQLPRTHCYYNDHVGSARSFDPLAALEAMRQAAILFAHVGNDVPLESAFLFTTAALEAVGDFPAHGQNSSEALVNGRIREWKLREGAKTGFVVDLELVLDSGHTTTLRAGAHWMPKSAWQKLRARQRVALDLTQSSPHSVSARIPAPRLGRELASNIVIGYPRIGEAAEFPLIVDMSYPGLFDHALDHIPAAVMFEAARQSCIHFAEARLGRSPLDWQVSTMSVDFLSIGELELAAETHVRIAGMADQSVDFEARVVQCGQVLATFAVGLTHGQLSAVLGPQPLARAAGE